jgi:hypothetical protein
MAVDPAGREQIIRVIFFPELPGDMPNLRSDPAAIMPSAGTFDFENQNRGFVRKMRAFSPGNPFSMGEGQRCSERRHECLLLHVSGSGTQGGLNA